MKKAHSKRGVWLVFDEYQIVSHTKIGGLSATFNTLLLRLTKIRHKLVRRHHYDFRCPSPKMHVIFCGRCHQQSFTTDARGKPIPNLNFPLCRFQLSLSPLMQIQILLPLIRTEKDVRSALIAVVSDACEGFQATPDAVLISRPPCRSLTRALEYHDYHLRNA